MPDKPLAGLTFNVQTFGCQMNKHDSERVAGILQSAGAIQTDTIESSDIVAFMTCCVRDSAETRLLGHVNSIKNLELKDASTLGRRIIAIGGCMGQRDGEALFDRANHIDVVFGPDNIDSLPDLIADSIDSNAHRFKNEFIEDSFSTSLPTVRETQWSAWLPITVGCNNFCTYCIVPHVRGKEKSRPLEDIVREAEGYVAAGVKEITLLGQNVNSYGTDLYGEPRFVDVLDAVSATGIERIRFATSHPKDLTDEVIERFRTLSNLMPALHLPVQSGANDILSKMNRRYTREHYLDLIDKVKTACPDIALSTDVIVGFPGETEQDFQDTCDLIDEVGYSQVFTFIFSPRTGTPAASYENQVPRDVAQKRFDQLFSIVEKRAYDANQLEVGRVVKVLVEGVSKKDADKLTGRNERNLNVHARIPDGKRIEDLIGTTVDVRIDEAKTWYLLGEVV